VTEINESNAHAPDGGHAPLIPAPRAPQDAPGVWRGDRDADAWQDAPAPDDTSDSEPVEGRVVTHQGRDLDDAEDEDGIENADDDTENAEDEDDLDAPLIPVRRIVHGTLRQPLYVLAGTGTVTRRTWEARTTARHERMMRAAEVLGDHDSVLEWEQRAAAFRKDRHDRRMAMLLAPVHAARAAVIGTATAGGALLLLGIVLAVSDKHLGEVVGPLLAVFHVIRFAVHLFAVLALPGFLTLLTAAILALWHTGRSRPALPAWLMPEHTSDSDGEPITPSAVVLALRDLGIGKLRTEIEAMGDAGAGMLGPIRIAGCGVEVDVTLPSGVNTAQIQARRRTLAENLRRHEHELFITIPPTPRTVRLWIADSGALDEPIGPSPLVLDPSMTSNYKSGRAPWGQDLRGDAALISLYQRHLLITGLSNQGKTAALRALALWLALHAIVEFRIADLKGLGDWRMFDGLASEFIEGPTDEHAIAATEMVEEGVEEMERRLMAPEGTVFTPLILIVDEAQNAFMNPAVGPDKRPYGGSKNTSRYFMACRKIHNQGRAVDVLLWQGTQDPTDQNLPKLVREGAHIRASLVVGTEAQSRMALGDKAVNGGAAPHKLRTGQDKGTLIVAGDGVHLEPGQSSITIRTHYIDTDQAIEIADRAKTLRKRTTRAAAQAGEDAEPRDLLDDLIEVIGDAEEPVPTGDIPALLRGLDPDWPGYRDLRVGALRAQLTALGIKLPSTGNRYPLDPADVVRAIARRDAANENTGE
jgi:S-DNA-T family DNA segregation ATPase FtsK/SpoIIIE